VGRMKYALNAETAVEVNMLYFEKTAAGWF
jgi:hypothetical protein